MTQPTKTS